MEKELAEAFAHDGAWTLEKIQLHKDNIDVIPSMYTEDAALLGEERIGRVSVARMPNLVAPYRAMLFQGGLHSPEMVRYALLVLSFTQAHLCFPPILQQIAR